MTAEIYKKKVIYRYDMVVANSNKKK